MGRSPLSSLSVTSLKVRVNNFFRGFIIKLHKQYYLFLLCFLILMIRQNLNTFRDILACSKLRTYISGAGCKVLSLNLNVLPLYSRQKNELFSKKTRRRVDLLLILAGRKLVKILEEQAYLLYKMEPHISKWTYGSKYCLILHLIYP